MSTLSELIDFTKSNICTAPIGKGVYTLHKAGETIYIGKAEGKGGIRARLEAHMNGEEGQCTQQATGYCCETTRNPSKKEEELLLEYRLAHGQYPLCNKT